MKGQERPPQSAPRRSSQPDRGTLKFAGPTLASVLAGASPGPTRRVWLRPPGLGSSPAYLSQQERSEHFPAAVAIEIDRRLFRVHEPLQAVAVHERAQRGRRRRGADAAELSALDTFFDDARVPPHAVLKKPGHQAAETLRAAGQRQEIKE